MKSISWVLISFLVVGASCKEDPAPIQNKELAGSWIWVASSGGFAGQIILADSVNYTQTLLIGSDHSFRWYKDDDLVKETVFSLDRGNSMYGDSLLTMHFANQNVPMTITFLRNDSLGLSENCYDCYTHGFVRVKSLE